MKTKMQQTSLFGFDSIKETLNNKEQSVLSQIIVAGKINDRETAERLNWPINRVTPRRNSLVKQNLVLAYDKQLDTKTGRPAIRWTVNYDSFIPDSC